jgi:hypothetical protein
LKKEIEMMRVILIALALIFFIYGISNSAMTFSKTTAIWGEIVSFKINAPTKTNNEIFDSLIKVGELVVSGTKGLYTSNNDHSKVSSEGKSEYEDTDIGAVPAAERYSMDESIEENENESFLPNGCCPLMGIILNQDDLYFVGI